MRRRFVPLITAALVVSVAAVAAAADRDVVLDADHQTVEFDGTKASGADLLYFGPAAGPCSKTEVAYCDDTLIRVTVPADAEHSTLAVSGIGNGTDDFDAYLYESEESGAAGTMVDFSNTEGTGAEDVTVAEPAAEYYLLRVLYYDVSDAAYHAKARLFLPDRFTATPTPTPTPSPTAEPAPPPAAAQPPAVARSAEVVPAAPTVRLVRRTRRSAIVRVTCPTTCRATLRAGRTRRSVGISAQDTHEVVIGRGQARRLVVTVTPRDGRPVVARYRMRTRGPAASRNTTR
jgi:hypothetical protein